ncbi:Uncharacterised protein [Mycobacteroides abscessus]|nr:Uncharacterised protein [Mycobacteroides abscessus]
MYDSTMFASPPQSYCHTWSRICALDSTRPALSMR